MEAATSVLIAVLLSVITLIACRWLFKSKNYWTLRGIPCVPGALPIFGNTLAVFRLKENLATWCCKIYNENRHRSMIGFYNVKQPTLMLRDPELVKIVLQTNFNSFQHNEHEMNIETDPLLGRDISFIRGQYWRDSRAIFVSAFSIKRIKTMSLTVERVCESLINYLDRKIAKDDGLELEAKFLFSRYTTEIAASTCLGIEGKSFDDDYANSLLMAMEKILRPSAKKTTRHNILFLLPGLSKVIKNSFVPPEVDRYFRKIVNDLEELRKDDGTPRDDVLRLMLDFENDGKVSREEALAHAFSFFVESYETSSLTASFVAYELANNPLVQEKLRREVLETVARFDGRLSYEAIHEMTYMEQVLSETLRLFPPVGYILRLCVEKCPLQGSDGLCVDVEPGTSVLVPILGLHRDPEIWRNSDKFCPDRFDKTITEERHKFTYLPFGEGPRACPGMRLGVIQVKAAIATILRHYRITLSPKMHHPARIDPGYFLITAAGGVWIKLEKLK